MRLVVVLGLVEELLLLLAQLLDSGGHLDGVELLVDLVIRRRELRNPVVLSGVLRFHAHGQRVHLGLAHENLGLGLGLADQLRSFLVEREGVVVVLQDPPDVVLGVIGHAVARQHTPKLRPAAEDVVSQH